MTTTTVGASLPAHQQLSASERTPARPGAPVRAPAHLTPRKRARSSTSALDAVTLDRVPRPSTSSTPPAPPQLLTVAQVCAALQLHPYTVRRYIARGSLPGVRLGRELRVDQRDLQAYVDQLQVRP